MSTRKSDYTFKEIADLLAEDKWKLGDGVAPGQTGGNTLTRYVEHKTEKVTHESWKQMEAFVAKWTSAKNYVDDSSAPSNIVVDPVTEDGASVETGTYYRGKLRRVRIAGERGGGDARWRIIQTLHKPSADTETFQTTENGCQYVTTRKFYFEQAAIPTVPAKSSGVETANVFQRDLENGFYNGYQEIKTRVYQTVPQFYTMQDAFGKSQLTQHLGVMTSENGNTIVTSGVTLPDPTAQSAGTLVEIRRSKNGDCTQDITVETKTAIAKASAATSDRKDKFQTSTSVDSVNQASAASAPARTDGVIVTTENKFNASSLYDTGVKTDTAIEVLNAQKSISHTPFEKREEVLDRNTAEPTLPTSQTAGKVKDTQDSVNEYGKHDVKTVERTAVAVTAATTSDVRDAFKTVATSEDVNQDAPITPTAQSDGTVVDVQSSKNDFAKYDNKTVTRTELAVSNATQAKEITATEVRTTAVDRGQVNAATLPIALTPGILVEKQDQLTEAKRHDITTTTRTAVPLTAQVESKQYSKFESVSEVVDRHTVADPTLPSSQTEGSIVETQDAVTDFGDHDITTRTRTAVKVEDAVTEKTITPFEVRTLNRDVHQETNAIALPSTQTAGTIKTVRKAIDDFGKETTDEEIRTTIAATSGVIDRKGYYSTDLTTEKKNQEAAETISTFTAGVKETVRNELNDAARYDTSKSVETATARAQDAYVASKDEYTQTTVTKKRNQVSAPTAIGVGERIDVEVNDFGRFDSTLTAETATVAHVDDGVAHDAWTINGQLYLAEHYAYVDLTSPIKPFGVPMYHYSYVDSIKQYQITENYAMYFYSTEALALTKVRAVMAALDGNDYTGTRHVKVAPNLWLVVLEWRTDVETASSPISFADPYAELH